MTNKDRTRMKQLILTEMAEVMELWPDIPVSRHIVTILRPYSASYDWTDEMLMKKIEKYRAELESDQDE